MKADAIIIGNLLQNRTRFAVPIYQRHYVWKRKEQWEPLWLDIRTKAIERLEGRDRRFSHYMGAVVLESQRSYSVRRVQSFQVIDGQQRLTTFQIFLAAARDYALHIGRTETAANITRYLTNSDSHLMEEPEIEILKVWPTKYDRDIFTDIITLCDRKKLRAKYGKFFYATRDQIYEYSTTPRILAAYGYFFDRIRHAVETDDLEDELFVAVGDDNDSNGVQEESAPTQIREGNDIPRELKLESLWQALVEEFKVVQIVLEEGDDAQVIFETLNGRGEPLLAADLVRNNIFHRAAENKEAPDELFKAHWTPFEDAFWEISDRQGRYKKPRIEFFIGNYIASQIATEVNLSKLFSEYKAFLLSENRKARRFGSVTAELQSLGKYGAIYRELIERSTDTALAAFSRRLLPWDVTTVFPLALRVWAEDGLAASDKERVLRVLMSYIVRRAVCGLSTKNYNKFFLTVVTDQVKNGWSASGIESYLSKQSSETSRWPRDDEFEHKWTTSPTYTSLGPARTRVVLEEIERAKRGKFQEVTALVTGLTVEHILPNTWFEHWPLEDGTVVTPEVNLEAMYHVSEDDSVAGKILRRNRLKHSIGNLTLLTQPLNSSVSAGPFAGKQAALLDHSVLVMNREITREKIWGETQVEARSKTLFAVARKLWPHPENPD